MYGAKAVAVCRKCGNRQVVEARSKTREYCNECHVIRDFKLEHLVSKNTPITPILIREGA